MVEHNRGYGLAAVLCVYSSCSARYLDLDQAPGAAGTLSGFIDEPPAEPTTALVSERDLAWSCPPDARRSRPPILSAMPPMPAVRYTVPIVDFNDDARSPSNLPDLTISACGVTDALCFSPYAIEVFKPLPDSPHVHEVSLPFALFGSLLSSAPGYVATNYNFGGPMIQDVAGLGIPLLRPELVERIVSDSGQGPVDPALGLLLLRVLDCQGNSASDVRIELTDTVGSSPIAAENLATASLGMGAPGLVGFMNVPPGVLLVESILDCFVGRPISEIKSIKYTVRPQSAGRPDSQGLSEGPVSLSELCGPTGQVSYGGIPVVVHAGRINMVEIRPDYSYGR